MNIDRTALTPEESRLSKEWQAQWHMTVDEFVGMYKSAQLDVEEEAAIEFLKRYEDGFYGVTPSKEALEQLEFAHPANEEDIGNAFKLGLVWINDGYLQLSNFGDDVLKALH